MSCEYLKGAHTIDGFACVAKHFPGNGLDFRDAHLSNNVNSFDLRPRAINAGCDMLLFFNDPDEDFAIMLVHVKGAESGMTALMKAVGMSGGSPVELLKKKLEDRGFEVFVYENPLDKMRRYRFFLSC